MPPKIKKKLQKEPKIIKKFHKTIDITVHPEIKNAIIFLLKEIKYF